VQIERKSSTRKKQKGGNVDVPKTPSTLSHQTTERNSRKPGTSQITKGRRGKTFYGKREKQRNLAEMQTRLKPLPSHPRDLGDKRPCDVKESSGITQKNGTGHHVRKGHLKSLQGGGGLGFSGANWRKKDRNRHVAHSEFEREQVETETKKNKTVPT